METAAGAGVSCVAGPVRLSPFAATRLSAARVGDPASARLLARPHRAVADRIQRWRRLGNLTQDAEPALYLHEYTSQGLTVRSVVGLLALDHSTEDPSSAAVLPHEDVDPLQALELAGRMQVMGVNPAPILLVHRGSLPYAALIATLTSGPPALEYVDRAGQAHRFWDLHDPLAIDALRTALAPARLIVADGHHRLAAYQQLQRELPGTGWDRGLAMIVDQTDTPLFLGAIHRVVRGLPLKVALRAVRESGVGELRPVPVTHQLQALDATTLVLTDGTAAWALALHPSDDEVPVEALHRRVLPMAPPHAVEYHHSVEATLKGLRPPGRGDEPRVGVLVPALSYDALDAVLTGGRRLPEKATSFQPKPSIGTIMRTL
ncbi:DUF1015 family protein [Nocardioides alkalitolerans]|uniref:DUF1015 family protein n=1 Tax=Nocardioides alkalitolerans TaxID=281714 RepID=UPI000418B8E5|nr:DUF1015 family protein [Nocardioides alkalitolerans]